MGVVLPGIIMGYIAFRGICNNQTLKEQENLKNLETNSRIFFAGIDVDPGRFMDEQT